VGIPIFSAPSFKRRTSSGNNRKFFGILRASFLGGVFLGLPCVYDVSVGAVRRLLVRAYGERGLATAFELAGREQPQKTAGVVDPVVTYTEATPLNCDAIEPGLAQAIMQAPSRVQRWMLAPPREPPPWRYRETGAEREAREQCERDGAWYG
jgi:hypothetical protein